MPVLLSGDTLTQTKIQEITGITAEKPATTSRASTTAHSADPHLALSLTSAGTWELQGFLRLSSDANAAGDFSWRLSWSGTATVTIGQHSLDTALASGSVASLTAGAFAPDASSPTLVLPIGCSTTATNALIRARIVSSTLVTVTLEWAQDGSNVNNTNLLSGSWITARRVT